MQTLNSTPYLFSQYGCGRLARAGPDRLDVPLLLSRARELLRGRHMERVSPAVLGGARCRGSLRLRTRHRATAADGHTRYDDALPRLVEGSAVRVKVPKIAKITIFEGF